MTWGSHTHSGPESIEMAHTPASAFFVVGRGIRRRRKRALRDRWFAPTELAGEFSLWEGICVAPSAHDVFGTDFITGGPDLIVPPPCRVRGFRGGRGGKLVGQYNFRRRDSPLGNGSIGSRSSCHKADHCYRASGEGQGGYCRATTA